MFYLGVILVLYFVIVNFDLNTAINTLFLLGFVIFVYVFEKNKKQKITL